MFDQLLTVIDLTLWLDEAREKHLQHKVDASKWCSLHKEHHIMSTLSAIITQSIAYGFDIRHDKCDQSEQLCNTQSIHKVDKNESEESSTVVIIRQPSRPIHDGTEQDGFQHLQRIQDDGLWLQARQNEQQCPHISTMVFLFT